MQPDGQPSAPPTLPPAPGSLRALRTLPVDDIGDEILELIYIYTQLYYQVKCRKQNVKAEDFVDEHQFIANVRQQESEFFEVFGKAMKANEDGDDMIAFLNHSAFRASPDRVVYVVDMGVTSKESMTKAIELSWNVDFIGDTVNALEEHIRRELEKGMLYARYCSIVQSSGMGKSRLLDEFSKRHFLIPINLRDKGSQGFPPADNEVRAFLSSIGRDDKDPAKQSYRRAVSFLEALFSVTAETISTVDKTPTRDPPSLAQMFREHMSEGQSMYASGPKRSAFYQRVVQKAAKNMPKDGLPVSEHGLCGALTKLCARLGSAGRSNVFPEVFIVFDEAHLLTKPFNATTTRNDFSELRRALGILQNQSLFTFFLSTTGKTSQRTPSRGHDPSNRMNDFQLSIPTPFIWLGFDQLMGKHKIFGKNKTLKHVTSLDCIAHMGRPLWGTLYDCGDEEVQRGLCQFALQKLLCATPGDKIVLTEAQKYALLSQRLALDVNSTIYVPLTPDEAEKEHHQITNHMRIAVSIGDGIETLRGVASSEPLLSEAAFLVMSNRSAFKLAEVLATVLRGFSINIGDRAELLVSAFFTWARDSTVLMKCHEEFPGQLSRYFSVNELFSSLFSEAIFESMSQNGPSLCHAETSRRTFENVFHDTSMHFNHFIKPQEQKIMARHYLPWFMARGAAALGANCQPGIDAVYPYLRGSLELDVKNLGFILVQVKKDDVSTESRAEIFKKMDPFACGLLHESDKMNGHFPIPLIRVVFALCGKPEFVHMTYSSPSNGASSLADTGQPCFTSYDFWCSGISPDVLQPVKESPGMWLALAGQLDSWQKFYSSATDPDLLRSQLPCAASDTAHFNSFWEF